MLIRTSMEKQVNFKLDGVAPLITDPPTTSFPRKNKYKIERKKVTYDA